MTLGFHKDTISGQDISENLVKHLPNSSKFHQKFQVYIDIPKEMERRGKTSNTSTFETLKTLEVVLNVADSIRFHQISHSGTDCAFPTVPTVPTVPSFHTPSCRPPATQPIGNLGTVWHCHKMSRDVTRCPEPITHPTHFRDVRDICNLKFNKFLQHLSYLIFFRSANPFGKTFVSSRYPSIFRKSSSSHLGVNTTAGASGSIWESARRFRAQPSPGHRRKSTSTWKIPVKCSFEKKKCLPKTEKSKCLTFTRRSHPYATDDVRHFGDAKCAAIEKKKT